MASTKYFRLKLNLYYYMEIQCLHLFTRCVKNIRFGRGWLPLISLIIHMVSADVVESKSWWFKFGLNRSISYDNTSKVFFICSFWKKKSQKKWHNWCVNSEYQLNVGQFKHQQGSSQCMGLYTHAMLFYASCPHLWAWTKTLLGLHCNVGCGQLILSRYLVHNTTTK